MDSFASVFIAEVVCPVTFTSTGWGESQGYSKHQPISDSSLTVSPKKWNIIIMMDCVGVNWQGCVFHFKYRKPKWSVDLSYCRYLHIFTVKARLAACVGGGSCSEAPFPLTARPSTLRFLVYKTWASDKLNHCFLSLSFSFRLCDVLALGLQGDGKLIGKAHSQGDRLL